VTLVLNRFVLALAICSTCFGEIARKNLHKVNSCFGSEVFATALILLLWAQPILAQTSTGTVGGTITDSSKEAVPGARVTLKNLATAIESYFHQQ